MIELEEEVNPQRKPFPPTIPVKETEGFKGIWIPWGKLVQLRDDCWGYKEEEINAQTNVWLEVLEMAIVESEEMGWKEREKMKIKEKKKWVFWARMAIEMVRWKMLSWCF